jgi:hypothetical protein
MDMFKMADANEFRRYAGLELMAKKAKRWRNLIVTNFPNKLHIDARSTPENPAFVFSGPIDELQSFTIKSICEDSDFFKQLVDCCGDQPT